MKKHYDSLYLNDTFGKLETLKTSTYDFFSTEHTLVELGCGNGLDAISLAELYRDSKIVGVDHDTVLIDEATKNAHLKAVSNVSFVVGDAEKLPLETNSIGGVRAERIFQHLKKPTKVLAEVKRVLRSEGKFVLIETDWFSFNMYNVEAKVNDLVRDYLTFDKVNFGMAARILSSELEEAGFEKITLTVHPFILSSFDEACALIKLDTIIEESVEKTKAKEIDYSSQLLIDKIKQLDEKGLFTLTLNMVVITAENK